MQLAVDEAWGSGWKEELGMGNSQYELNRIVPLAAKIPLAEALLLAGKTRDIRCSQGKRKSSAIVAADLEAAVFLMNDRDGSEDQRVNEGDR
jgi:hypothetical protein